MINIQICDKILDAQNKTEKEGPKKVLCSLKIGPISRTLPLFILPGI